MPHASIRTLSQCLLAITLVVGGTQGFTNIKPDDTERPSAITVAFSSGSATFNLNKSGIVERIEFHVNGKTYLTTLVGCHPLNEVRFDTARFFDGFPDRSVSGTFTLTFQMGGERSRAYSQLPLVQVSMSKGKTGTRLITRQIAQNSGFSFPLCPSEQAS